MIVAQNAFHGKSVDRCANWKSVPIVPIRIITAIKETRVDHLVAAQVAVLVEVLVATLVVTLVAVQAVAQQVIRTRDLKCGLQSIPRNISIEFSVT